MRGYRPPTTALCAALFVLSAPAAFAEPVRIDLVGEITLSTLPNSGPGDPLNVSIFVNSKIPDENAALGSYLATDTGTGTFQFKDLTPGAMDVLSITADTGSDEWVARLWTEPAAGSHPVTITLNGPGMTPDQILPDFASFTGGTAFFDGSLTWFGFVIYVDILSIEVVPVPVPVPALPVWSWLLLSLLFPAAFKRATLQTR